MPKGFTLPSFTGPSHKIENRVVETVAIRFFATFPSILCYILD